MNSTGIPAVEFNAEVRAAMATRAESLLQQHQAEIHRRTDHVFAVLMVLQWIGGVVAAVLISPTTWIGAQSRVHEHIWAALLLGGLIAGYPVFMALRHPGRSATRHAIALGQMLMSALLIHLTGGRIETHFHVFGSLAFLAFYRDLRVVTLATVVVALDHFLRGVFWPQSVFGVLTAGSWRWVEHAGWVIFEDVFLFISIRQSQREMRLIAERQARLEATNQSVERIVEKRTLELQAEIQDRIKAQTQLEQTHEQLIRTSRQAGQAEVATSVLHNVGNVLNSVNTSAGLIAGKLKNSKVSGLNRVADLFEQHRDDLPEYLAAEGRAAQVQRYIATLAGHVAAEQEIVLRELHGLTRNIDHIKDIVTMQQGYAKVSGVPEPVTVTELLEDALRMNASSLARHDILVTRDLGDLPPILVEKHKVLQILVNLVRNAKNACDETGRADKQMLLRAHNGEGRVKISVSDNGIGIPPENLARIFGHGFTTKKDGHGFGLHSGALAAKEMGGELRVYSDGPGCGATFTLELPFEPPKASV